MTGISTEQSPIVFNSGWFCRWQGISTQQSPIVFNSEWFCKWPGFPLNNRRLCSPSDFGLDPRTTYLHGHSCLAVLPKALHKPILSRLQSNRRRTIDKFLLLFDRSNLKKNLGIKKFFSNKTDLCSRISSDFWIFPQEFRPNFGFLLKNIVQILDFCSGISSNLPIFAEEYRPTAKIPLISAIIVRNSLKVRIDAKSPLGIAWQAIHASCQFKALSMRNIGFGISSSQSWTL